MACISQVLLFFENYEWVNLRKEEGRTRFYEGWQGCPKVFLERKTRGAALTTRLTWPRGPSQ